MNSFKRLAGNKSLIAVIILLAAWLSPPGAAYRKARAETLAASAETLSDTQSVARYRSALWLYDTPETANKLAEKYLELGRGYEAMLLLKGRGEEERLRAASIAFKFQDFQGTLKITATLKDVSRGERLAAYALLELSRADEAAAKARAAKDTGAAGLWRCMVLYGAKRGGECASLEPPVNGSEAAQRLARLEAGEAAQAQELLREGLLKSAERLLEGISEPNTEVSVMLARLRLSDKAVSQEKLRRAEADLTAALARDPGSLELHRLRHEALIRLEDKSAAEAEQRLIDQLVSGKV